MAKTELEDDMLKEIVKTFDKPQRNYRTMWRIRIKGDFVRMGSGKHIWRRRGDALNALIYHLDRVLRQDTDGVYLGDTKLADGRADLSIIARQLIDRGFVELVEIPIDD